MLKKEKDVKMDVLKIVEKDLQEVLDMEHSEELGYGYLKLIE
jgi:hypothetical protein